MQADLRQQRDSRATPHQTRLWTQTNSGLLSIVWRRRLPRPDRCPPTPCDPMPRPPLWHNTYRTKLRVLRCESPALLVECLFVVRSCSFTGRLFDCVYLHTHHTGSHLFANPDCARFHGIGVLGWQVKVMNAGDRVSPRSSHRVATITTRPRKIHTDTVSILQDHITPRVSVRCAKLRLELS